jgi:hypothetical protein
LPLGLERNEKATRRSVRGQIHVHALVADEGDGYIELWTVAARRTLGLSARDAKHASTALRSIV